MYNAETIKTELIGLVGWRQNPDPKGWQLTELLSSSSGRWFNSAHPLLTIQNLQSVAPMFSQIEQTDSARDVAFTAWVRERTEQSILNAIDCWIESKFENKTAQNLLSRSTLFETSSDQLNFEINKSRIVGMEIVPTRGKSIVTKIKKIGLHLSQNQTLQIKLFKSGQTAPVETFDADYNQNGSYQSFTVDWTLDPSGAYWVAYHQNELTGQAVNGVNDYTAREYIGSVTHPNEKYFKATAFSVPGNDANALWDVATASYTRDTNYGINLDLDVRCDYTDFIVDQKDLFRNLIFLQVGMDFLREIALNPNSRINRNEANVSKTQLLYEIDGDSQGRNEHSIWGRYKKALNAIQLDTTGIEKICLPCKRRGIRYRAIGPR